MEVLKMSRKWGSGGPEIDLKEGLQRMGGESRLSALFEMTPELSAGGKNRGSPPP